MTKLLDEILATVYEDLSKSGALDDRAIKALRTAFTSGKKLKADDFVTILLDDGKEKPS